MSNETFAKGGTYLDWDACKVMRRVPTRIQPSEKEHAGDFAAEISEYLKFLSPDPIIWHGNGFSKQTYYRLRIDIVQCSKAMTIH